MARSVISVLNSGTNPPVLSRDRQANWQEEALQERSAIYRKLMWIMLVACALRIFVRLYTGSSDFWQNGYTFFFTLAQNLASGNGLTYGDGSLTSFRVPLYPAFLAAVTQGHQAFFPIIASQALIGAGTVLCTGLIARTVFSNSAAIIAAALTAVYPYYVVHDTALQETSMYIFFMALAVLLLLRVRRSGSILTAMAAGLALGAAVLTRVNLAPVALVAPLWVALAGGSHAAPWRRRFGVAIVCASIAMLTVAPWLIRVYQLTGSVTLSAQSGFFLWLGNNPYTFSRYPQESIDESQVVALAALSSQGGKELEACHNEALIDEWFRRKGVAYIRDHPWSTLRNGFRKVVDAFGWLPSPRRSFWPSLAHILSYGPVMIIGLLGMLVSRRHWREHSIFYAQFACFAAVTAVFFGHTSYRSYLDVYWIVFAAGALTGSLAENRPPRRLPSMEAGLFETRTS
jgi:4-amino-4-deoxy-L-arabinose transferase-like glycosyltransferase